MEDELLFSRAQRSSWRSGAIKTATPSFATLMSSELCHAQLMKEGGLSQSSQSVAAGLEGPLAVLLCEETAVAKPLEMLERAPLSHEVLISASLRKHEVSVRRSGHVDRNATQAGFVRKATFCFFCYAELYNTYFACLGCERHGVEPPHRSCLHCLGRALPNANSGNTQTQHVVHNLSPSDSPAAQQVEGSVASGESGSPEAGHKRKDPPGGPQVCKCKKGPSNSVCGFCHKCTSCLCHCHQQFVLRRQCWEREEMKKFCNALLRHKVQTWLRSNAKCDLSSSIAQVDPPTTPLPMQLSQSYLIAAVYATIRLRGVFRWLVHLRNSQLLLPAGAIMVKQYGGSDPATVEYSPRELLTRLEIVQTHMHSQPLSASNRVDLSIMSEWADGVLHRVRNHSRQTMEPEGPSSQDVTCPPAAIIKVLLTEFSAFEDYMGKVGLCDKEDLHCPNVSHNFSIFTKLQASCKQCGNSDSYDVRHFVYPLREETISAPTDLTSLLTVQPQLPFTATCDICKKTTQHTPIHLITFDPPQSFVLDVSSSGGLKWGVLKKMMLLPLLREQSQSQHLQPTDLEERSEGKKSAQENSAHETSGHSVVQQPVLYQLVAAIYKNPEKTGYAVDMVAPSRSSRYHPVAFDKGDLICYDGEGGLKLRLTSAEVRSLAAPETLADDAIGVVEPLSAAETQQDRSDNVEPTESEVQMGTPRDSGHSAVLLMYSRTRSLSSLAPTGTAHPCVESTEVEHSQQINSESTSSQLHAESHKLQNTSDSTMSVQSPVPDQSRVYCLLPEKNVSSLFTHRNNVISTNHALIRNTTGDSLCRRQKKAVVPTSCTRSTLIMSSQGKTFPGR